MQIDITGYVTEASVSYSFKVKVTSDSVERLSLSNLQISKEVRISIPPYFYPLDDNSKFIKLTARGDPHLNDPRQNKINKCLSFVGALREGDQIECSVFIVEEETRVINRNRRDIETYADFDLWIYPDNRYFRRSESDSRESLKFRKQWRYTCLNREKCRKVADYAYQYRNRWWINKNPKIIRPIIWGIRVKTAVSNLWRRFIRQENLQKNKLAVISIVATILFGIIGIVVGIIF